MSDFGDDYAAARARAEKRLRPEVRLWWRRRLLVAMVIGFGLFTIFVSGQRSYYAQVLVRLGLGYWENYEFVSMYSTNYIAIAAVVWVLWGLLIPLYTLSLILAYGRERAIQREMNREMELEKMRLQVELMRLRGHAGESDEYEKPKRAVSLTDDGELNYDETSTPRRNANHQ